MLVLLSTVIPAFYVNTAIVQNFDQNRDINISGKVHDCTNKKTQKTLKNKEKHLDMLKSVRYTITA